MNVAIWAGLAMIVQDILGVILVQAEAANKGWLAGVADTVGWYFAIATTSISVTALQSHSTSEKVYVLLFVGVANLLGTKTGQLIGARLLGRWPPKEDPHLLSLEARVTALENTR